MRSQLNERVCACMWFPKYLIVFHIEKGGETHRRRGVCMCAPWCQFVFVVKDGGIVRNNEQTSASQQVNGCHVRPF